MDSTTEMKLNLTSRLEQLPLIERTDVDLQSYKKISLDYLPELGAACLALSKTARTAISSIETTGLYRAILPEGATHLAMAKDGSGMIGTALSSRNSLVGQTRFKEVGTLTQTTTMPVDPATICMAAALMSIEQKLDSIKEVSDNIFQLIELQDRTELKGDFITLRKIAKDYKCNWDNALFTNNNHIEVLNIKRDAQKKVSLYQEKINKTLNGKRGLLHTKSNIKKFVNTIKDELSDYQLALYVYSYSVYLDMLLSNRFDKNSLSLAIDDMFVMSEDYRKIFAKAFAQIADDSSDSLERVAMKGAAFASKISGELIAKIPLINKSLIDESLIETGERLSSHNDEEFIQLLENVLKLKNSGVTHFVDNLREIKEIYNNPMDVVVDQDYVYYKNVDETVIMKTKM